MINFIEWCKEKNIELSDDLVESATRSGIRPAYPDGYVRSQYPDGYFSPTSATAHLDLKNSKNLKHKVG